jgi:hypothetical protein
MILFRRGCRVHKLRRRARIPSGPNPKARDGKSAFARAPIPLEPLKFPWTAVTYHRFQSADVSAHAKGERAAFHLFFRIGIFGLRGQIFFQPGNQRRQIVLAVRPNPFRVHVVVIVDERVTHADDQMPRHFRQRLQRVGRKMARLCR